MAVLGTAALLALSLTFVCIPVDAAGGNHEWNYKRGDALGPENWSSLSPQYCQGVRNSPIDIQTSDALPEAAEEWRLDGWDESAVWTVHDIDHTVQYDLEKGKITTAGGMLGSTYDLVQFHFHWGQSDLAGSEHLVDGASYPMEVHLVHVRSYFNSPTEAIQSNQGDAAAALGFFFELQDEDNAALEEMLSAIPRATESANSSVSGHSFGPLTRFLQESLDGGYYRYEGGLTTPSCNEIIQWTVFKKPIGISAAQLETFRRVETTYGSERYRPVQPLGDRVVTLYTPEEEEEEQTEETTRQIPVVMILGGAAGAGALASVVIIYIYFKTK